MGMTKYRKKPVVVEAKQWVGGPESATPIINWILENGDRSARYNENQVYGTIDEDTGKPEVDDEGNFVLTMEPEHLQIDTLEGVMRADAGDFIIQGVNGEFYPCKPEIFAKTYEIAE